MSHALVSPCDSPYLVPFDGSFRVAEAATAPPGGAAKKKPNKAALKASIEKLRPLQRALYAHDKYSLLLVFQAMDAAGKDGTIRAVMSGVNPAGCQVFSFKQPSSLELDHDFMWRVYQRLPERGRIGIFNRSHYEEVLVVRVHPEFLDGQKLPRLDLTRGLGGASRVHRQLRTPSGAQRHRHPQVLAQRVPRSAAQAVSRSDRRALIQLEVLRRRRARAGILEPIYGRV